MLCILLICSCTSTIIEKSWRDPDTIVSMEKLSKVLVVALLKDETSRRTTEDKLVAMLNGKGVASYTYDKADIKKQTEEKAFENLKNDGFDGAVIMKLVDSEKDVEYTPGTYSSYPVYYRTFRGYYYRSWNNYYTPGYYSTTKTFSVETSIYSIQKDKLIWSALTKTTNPSGVDKMTSEIADVIYKKMQKEGFITR